MNRLTKRNEKGIAYLAIADSLSKRDQELEGSKPILEGLYAMFQKLAEYEDIGFEPEEVKQLNASDVSKEESSIKYYNEMRKYRDELKYYKDLEKQLIDKYNELKNKIDGDGVENYTNGYKYGHRNGQIELLEWILKIDTGCREEAEKALE
jgi:hypothetical protein